MKTPGCRAGAVALALLSTAWIAACTDEPLAPPSAQTPTPPDLAIIGGTFAYEALPGETTAEVAAVTGRTMQAVGTSGDRPVFWPGPGQPEELPTLPGSTANRPHDAKNETVVGEAVVSGETRMVMWDLEARTVTDLGIVLAPGTPRLTLEPSGYAAGTTPDPALGNRAFVWRAGVMQMLEPLPGDDETEAHFVGWRGSVLGISRSSGTDDGTIVVWPLGEPPAAVPFDEAAYAPSGFIDFSTQVEVVVLSSRAGDRVLIWDSGVVTEVPNPNASTGGLYGAVAWNGVDILGWVQPDAGSERQYAIWTDEGGFFLFHPLTPGWECPIYYLLHRVICTDEFRPFPFMAEMKQTHPDIPDGVPDLRPVARTASSITLAWTQIDDGTGAPADYRVKYRLPPMDWRTGIVGCSRVVGTQIGATLSCTVSGLDAMQIYDFQLMSFRLENGLWAGALRSNVATGVTGGAAAADRVQDLSIDGATPTTLTVSWTQVDDGTGNPAWYRVKYGSPIVTWKAATIGCERTIRGDEIGAPISCTLDGLEPATSYDVRLMSYRVEDGAWVDARYSNTATGSTTQ